MNKDIITFSFGANWRSFVKKVSQETISSARSDITAWLSEDQIKGKTVLDIGCGSGIHSLGFLQLGAKEVVSFDYDIKSVEATQILRGKSGSPAHWKVLHGSILEHEFIQKISKGEGFDIVYAWGVLHHTGSMWEAIENSCKMVKKGGHYWIAIYDRGPYYQRELALKIKYNRASLIGKKMMVARHIIRHTWPRVCDFLSLLRRGKFKELKNPLAWNKNTTRGMNMYHDLIDWLGGLPYEVANVDEITLFVQAKGFVLDRFQTGEANNVYLFSFSNR